MNLRNLSDETLHNDLGLHIKREMNETKYILHHLVEVDRRGLHLKLGYSTLRDYLTSSFGYDNSKAQRRIDAAKLSLAVPTLIESMDQGEISQSQVSFLQKCFRESNEKVSIETKVQLIEQIKNKSVSETQVIVAKALDLKIIDSPKVTYQQNNTVNFTCPLDLETWEKMEQMRELLSTAVPSGNWQEILKHLAEKVIASKTPKASKENKVIQLTPKSNNSAPKLSAEIPKSNEGPVPLAISKQVLYRDKCCQFVSKTSGKKCNSLWNLQVDHIKPRWAGGDNSPENLRALCANHNRMIYREQAGIRRV